MFYGRRNKAQAGEGTCPRSQDKSAGPLGRVRAGSGWRLSPQPHQRPCVCLSSHGAKAMTSNVWVHSPCVPTGTFWAHPSPSGPAGGKGKPPIRKFLLSLLSLFLFPMPPPLRMVWEKVLGWVLMATAVPARACSLKRTERLGGVVPFFNILLLF